MPEEVRDKDDEEEKRLKRLKKQAKRRKKAGKSEPVAQEGVVKEEVGFFEKLKWNLGYHKEEAAKAEFEAQHVKTRKTKEE